MAHVLVGPRRALCSSTLLHALRIGQIVCCAVEPPPRSAHGSISCLQLAPPYGERHRATRPSAGPPPLPREAIIRLVERAAIAGRSTLLIGGESTVECAGFAAALLMAREGLSPYDATLRVEQVCVAAAGAAEHEP